ncbi:MAG: peroxiredoxin [Actinomycetes bacterium]
MALEIGSAAPDFSLKDQHGQVVTLSSFKGKKNVVILFYPYSFTGTCTGELCAMRDDLSSFHNDGVELLAISCDTPFTQRVFAEKEGYNFPVLSDFWPHGAAAMAYGIFDEGRGCALRGTYIVDKEGILRWQVANAIGDARSNEEYKAALAAL